MKKNQHEAIRHEFEHAGERDKSNNDRNSVRGDFWALSVKILVFQIQLVTCCDLLVFLYQFEIHSIDSAEMVSNFPEVLNFNW